ncbi:uncharacterized protein LOC123534359 [Mercenaria mercenaria]|uniref:uncharacterized protein LOC123534359 n=1 Tax=Mercenaria mercenaria TaxID=6596 RepID=UPI00234F626E|nr:uncharacterized protein LOC123534359 [Mercenaria mercenaria]
MRRLDAIKIMFVCLCIWHMCPAHQCGDNPLMLVDEFSRERGFNAEAMLEYMRERFPNDYEQLMTDYREYLACRQMMNTGYFKRSVDEQETFHSVRQQHINNVDKQFKNKYGDIVKVLFGSRQQVPDLSKDNFNSIPAINTESLDNPLDNQDDLPFIIKRLLRRSKLPALHLKRNRRLRAKYFMDV